MSASAEDILQQCQSFSRYQWFQIMVVLWCQLCTACNTVFMVFAGSKSLSSTNATTITPGCDPSVSSNCSGSDRHFHSFYSEWSDGDLSDYTIASMMSLQLIGSLLGALVSGQLSDWYGRKITSWTFFSITVAIVTASALCESVYAMIACRFLIGFSTGAYDSAVVVLMMEWTRAENRLLVQNSLDCMNSIGFIWLSFLAMQTASWRILSLVCGLQGIFCVLLFRWMIESPVWLTKMNRLTETGLTFRLIASWNRFDFFTPALRNTGVDEDVSVKQDRVKKCSYLDLFRTRKMCSRTIALMYSFFFTGVVGFTLIINMDNLSGDMYVNFALLGVVNICSAIISFAIERLLKPGRKIFHFAALTGVSSSVAALCILYIIGVQEDLRILFVVFSLCGSIFSYPLWVICNLYSGELYPTSIRAMGSGIGSVSARFGGIIAPQLLYLIHVSKPLPFLLTVIFGLVNIFVAGCMFPETRSKSLLKFIPCKVESATSHQVTCLIFRFTCSYAKAKPIFQS
ncbi:unnamed protein product [Soboliphyme baturini]|uniref:MFS domain-containing protein n=1 Tax=Soboliphyme baturini TaxID=241478 RepID=A0A183IIB6_9BILA|nr:unnamed protein product [Soboliphyme baturini]